MSLLITCVIASRSDKVCHSLLLVSYPVDVTGDKVCHSLSLVSYPIEGNVGVFGVTHSCKHLDPLNMVNIRQSQIRKGCSTTDNLKAAINSFSQTGFVCDVT